MFREPTSFVVANMLIVTPLGRPRPAVPHRPLTDTIKRYFALQSRAAYRPEGAAPDDSCQSKTTMTTRSNTRAKKALEVLMPPHHKMIITSEIAADASTNCGHHP